MWFDLDVLDFQVKPLTQIFWIFGQLFPKIGQNFNKFPGHTGHDDSVNCQLEVEKALKQIFCHVLATFSKNWANV